MLYDDLDGGMVGWDGREVQEGGVNRGLWVANHCWPARFLASWTFLVFGLGPPQLKTHRTPSWVTLGRLFNGPIEVRAVGFLWRRESERLTNV